MKNIIFGAICIISNFCFSQVPEKYTRDWGTYIGSHMGQATSSLRILDIAVDEAENVWAVGEVRQAGTAFMDTIVTPNAHQATFGGGRDGFILKFSPQGNLLYATYFGGAGNDEIQAIDIKGGKVHITGTTTSPQGIATPGAYQETLHVNTNPDGDPLGGGSFIAQFDAVTGQLDWGTYFQGDQSARLYHIKTGNANDVFVWGDTRSSNLGTPGAFRETIPPPIPDGSGGLMVPDYPILARFDDTGQLLWATYYAPDINTPNNTVIAIYHGLGVDSLNDVYVSGASVDNEGYYGTPGAHQTTVAGSGAVGNAFISKFSASGQRLWSTYYGGEGGEAFTKLAVPRDNHIYLTGLTHSTTGIATPGTWIDTYNGSTTSPVTRFITKFNISGQQVWGSYLDVGVYSNQSVDVNQNGNIFNYYNGNNSLNNIVPQGSYQDAPGGGVDGFLFQMNTMGTGSDWASFYGGSGNEGLNWNEFLAISDNNTIYIAGYTGSHDNMATENAFQTTIPQYSNSNFIAKFIPCPTSTLPVAPSPQEYGFGMTLDDLEVEFIEWTGSDLIITWYADEDGTIELTPGTTLENGDTYYVSQQIQGCDESAPVAVTVIACTPPALPLGNETQEFAVGDTLEDLDVTGSDLTWYADEDRTIVLPPNTELQDEETYYVSQTVDGCESGLLAVTVVAVLGMEMMGLNKISLYPNPNKGSFMINGLPMTTATLTLYDLQGRTIHTELSESANHLLELKQGVGTGVYLLQIKVEQESKVFKVIVE